MKLAYLTAGAAGMYCGSCMHDNALARELQRVGVDCVLLPVYTPIRTDEQDVSESQVFFGGVHIYLLQKAPWLRWVPRPVRRWLDAPPFLRWATRRTATAPAKTLGELTISMLEGSDGRQAEEVHRLATWLADHLNPDCVLLSNLLIGGAIPEIRKRCPDATVCVTLQGDDIFLDYLLDQHRQRAVELMRGLVPQVDRFIVHSQFYAEKMGRLLEIPSEKLVVLPLAIDAEPFGISDLRDESDPNDAIGMPEEDGAAGVRPPRIGYLARLAPEKGLHHLVEAFISLATRSGIETLELHIAGYEGPQHAQYIAALKDKLQRVGLSQRVRFHGSPDLAGKVAFLQQLDLLCVPTEYEDPKGLFILEAWAAGVPVVQPDHGAFSELVTGAQAGCLVPPMDPGALADRLHAALLDEPGRLRWQEAGRNYVRQQATITIQARKLLEVLRSLKPT
ncbi:glycosyltransferase family 4 protein [Roseimaritima sediminicola]|uniref:glycosyltransferase family 4 protein n=1 Tax=Roseimaritima sediminicola TaxID=2662066 RepID=UPI0012982407|nr:glycosyltransferase family 4 protein [Roseimaritima sediminicola]